MPVGVIRQPNYLKSINIYGLLVIFHELCTSETNL